MRFYSFLKNNKDKYTDKEMTEFAQWFEKSVITKNNPHAGVPQIVLFLSGKDLPVSTKIGFVKWGINYFEEPKNMLPSEIKTDIHTAIAFFTRVFNEDVEITRFEVEK